MSPVHPPSYSGYTYRPIGIKKSGSTSRYLLNPTIIEASITVGGGGWGAENVGNRETYGGTGDDLYVRGSIAEVARGVVGVFDSNTGTTINGYTKHYYYDERWSPPGGVCFEAMPGDLNGDCIVDSEDFVIMASHWLNTDCADNNNCDGADLDLSGTVDWNDLMIFCQQWLEGAGQ